MKKVLFMAFAMALIVATVSCNDSKKKHKKGDADEELVDDDEDEGGELSDMDEAFVGIWSANTDPGAIMQIANEEFEFDDEDCYGYITTYNEYYEGQYNYVFEELEVEDEDGKVLRAEFNKTEMRYVGSGDPDDYDETDEDYGGWESVSIAHGTCRITLNDDGSCTISSGDSRINHMQLYKQD